MEDGDVRRIECEAVEVEKLKALAAERAARREALERVDLKELEMRLYLRAEAKLRTMRWRGAYGGKPPGGNKAMDFVQNAFTGFLEGKRTWDHCPETIFNVLADFIRADASRLANKAENSKTSRATSTPEDAGLDTADISSVAAPELSSPQVILEEQGKEQKLLSLFPEGSAERAVVEEIISGDEESSRKIREGLKLSPSTYSNIKRRIQRRLRRENPVFIKPKSTTQR